MAYTVKQLADLAGVTRRTLHYYDEVGLLKPVVQGANRYRYYDGEALLRLQQILFYREMGLRLAEIREILDHPDFDVVLALQAHKDELHIRVERLNRLISTVDKTINHLTGGRIMSKKEIFNGFSEEKQAEYAQQARQKYGSELVDESMQRWGSYSAEKKEQIKAEGEAVYHEIYAYMDKGHKSPDVQVAVAKWHQHLRYFYEPTYGMLRGLGQMYKDSPDFRVNFEKLSPNFPEFLCEAIQFYCEGK
jgi:DNA-binding transcriptional MerR regulator